MMNFNGIKQSLLTLLPIDRVIDNSTKNEYHTTIVNNETKRLDGNYSDYKTLLGTSYFDLFRELNSNLILYFFIEKHDNLDERNAVIPIIYVESINEYIVFNDAYFSLQGCGGGLSKTDSLLAITKKQSQKGYNVSIQPRVVESNLFNAFKYFDSGVKEIDLINESYSLNLYRKGVYLDIYEAFNFLISKNKIKNCA